MASISNVFLVESFYHKIFTKKEIPAMKKNTTVLANLLSHFPRSEFEKSVIEHGGDHRVRVLSTYNLLKCLLYGQVTHAFSVREIESSLACHSSQLYHCGMQPVKRSTLCDALEKRDSRIFEDTFNALVATARQLAGTSGRRFRNPLKIIDASTIELCLSRFDWAKFRTTKGAVKLHVSLDGDYFFPDQVRLSTGAIHEVNEMGELSKAPGMIFVMDRGYVDYKRLYDINLGNSTFVTRRKDKCQHELVEIFSSAANEPVWLDASIRLTSPKGKEKYPDLLRQVCYHDDEHDRDYEFLTNNFELSAQEIADIYKARWQVELFFKWIKQNLKIKTFWGTSRNAVFIQIWVALITFLLLWIGKIADALDASTQRILQVLKTSILARSTIQDLFRRPDPPVRSNQLELTLWGIKC